MNSFETRDINNLELSIYPHSFLKEDLVYWFTNNLSNRLQEALGKKLSFFVTLEGGQKEVVNLPYDKAGSSVMETRMKEWQ